jgi:NADPH:quinone reductase-like Zn-dependent oxidoreductase
MPRTAQPTPAAAPSMHAVVLTRYGGPEVLQLQELPKPAPRDGEVLVKVRASAVNDWDWCFMRGQPYPYRLLFGLTRPKLRVLGAELAGTVAAVGAGVQQLREGDDVYGDVSEAGFGAFAEYVCVPERALAKKPPSMTFEQAAALPHAAMLALQGLVDIGQIRRGERVLINGAGGGVGILGVQLAKRYAAEVTGVDSGPKLAMLKAVGFDRVLDYQTHDFTRDGERYDLILDTKTNRSPLRYLRCLTPRGRYVTVGGEVWSLLQTALAGALISAFRPQQVRIVALKPNKDLAYANELFETGGLRSVLDGPYPLQELPRAMRRFGAAEHIGKVVISVSA